MVTQKWKTLYTCAVAIWNSANGGGSLLALRGESGNQGENLKDDVKLLNCVASRGLVRGHRPDNSQPPIKQAGFAAQDQYDG